MKDMGLFFLERVLKIIFYIDSREGGLFFLRELVRESVKDKK